MKPSILHILVLATLSGCASVAQDDAQSYDYMSDKLSNEININTHSWMKTNFDKYESSPNNKAFAVYWKGNRALSFGFASDKIDLDKAKSEALKLCNIKSEGGSSCTIEAYSAHSDELTFTNINLPREVSSYSDLDKLEKFDNTQMHAAIVGNELGLLGFAIDSVSQDAAEEAAMMQCLKNTHYSMPTCNIIKSK